MTLCASPAAFRVVLSIVDVEGDDGFGVCLGADLTLSPRRRSARRGRATNWRIPLVHDHDIHLRLIDLNKVEG